LFPEKLEADGVMHDRPAGTVALDRSDVDGIFGPLRTSGAADGPGRVVMTIRSGFPGRPEHRYALDRPEPRSVGR